MGNGENHFPLCGNLLFSLFLCLRYHHLPPPPEHPQENTATAKTDWKTRLFWNSWSVASANSSIWLPIHSSAHERLMFPCYLLKRLHFSFSSENFWSEFFLSIRFLWVFVCGWVEKERRRISEERGEDLWALFERKREEFLQSIFWDWKRFYRAGGFAGGWLGRLIFSWMALQSRKSTYWCCVNVFCSRRLSFSLRASKSQFERFRHSSLILPARWSIEFQIIRVEWRRR